MQKENSETRKLIKIQYTHAIKFFEFQSTNKYFSRCIGKQYLPLSCTICSICDFASDKVQ